MLHKTLFLMVVLCSTTFAVNLTDFGAIANDEGSDSPALQAALAQVCSDGGGEIVFPRGKTILSSDVGLDCGFASHLTLRGNGDALVELRGAPTTHYFSVGNLGAFALKDLLFMSFREVTDGKYVFIVSAQTVVVDQTIFANIHVQNSIFLADHSAVTSIKNTQFAGCGGQATLHTYGVTNLNVTDSVFIDYFNYKGVYYSKSPWGVASWIYAQEPAARGKPSTRITGSFFDEAAFYAVNVENAESFVFEHNGVNLNGGTDAYGVRSHNVDNALVRNNRFGYVSFPRGAALFSDTARFEFSDNTLFLGVQNIKVTGAKTKLGAVRFNRSENPFSVLNDSGAQIEIQSLTPASKVKR